MKKTRSRVDLAELASLRAALARLRGANESDLEVGRVAARHRIEEVLEVLASRDPALSRALLRTLAIELALRGKPIPREHPELRRLEQADPSEPPPWLLSIESELPARVVRFGGAPGGLAWAGTSEPRGVVPREPLTVAAWYDVTSDVDRDAIGAPVRAWTQGSNGRFEVRVFALEGARGAHVDGALLHALGLEAVPSPEDVRTAPTRPEYALGELFSAAHGGAYNGTAADAWARDAAWRSLRALVGSPAGLRASDVERDARAAGLTWFGDTPFFETVWGWNVGLAVVSPARDRLATLAATDID